MTKNIKTAKIEGDKIVINYSTKDNHPSKSNTLILPIKSKKELYSLKVLEIENELVNYLQKKINSHEKIYI